MHVALQGGGKGERGGTRRGSWAEGLGGRRLVEGYLKTGCGLDWSDIMLMPILISCQELAVVL